MKMKKWIALLLACVMALSLMACTADGKKYRLSADKPCRLEKGDILFVGGLTRLVFS